MFRIGLVIALVIGLIAPAFAQRAEIEAVNAKWIDLFNKGDVAGVASLYTDDATALRPDLTLDVPSGPLRRARLEPSASRPRARIRRKLPANTSWFGKRSETIGGLRPISGTTASSSRTDRDTCCGSSPPAADASLCRPRASCFPPFQRIQRLSALSASGKMSSCLDGRQ